MHKKPSFWPNERSLFRATRHRKAAVWAVVGASVAAAFFVAVFWRNPTL